MMKLQHTMRQAPACLHMSLPCACLLIILRHAPGGYQVALMGQKWGQHSSRLEILVGHVLWSHRVSQAAHIQVSAKEDPDLRR